MQAISGTSYFPSIMGLNHLSAEIMHRILKPTLTDTSGAICKGISNLELLSLIYFSKIANENGIISDFYITELSNVIHSTERQCYNVLESLAKKGFLTISEPNWKGTRRIFILHTKFSKKEKKKRRRDFVSLDYAFLDHFDLQHYQNFCKLSLYAKKLLLLVLLLYKPENGYRVNLDLLAARLHLKNKYLVLHYLKELESVIGTNSYSVYENKAQRKKFDIVFFHPSVITTVEDGKLNIKAMDHKEKNIKEFYPVILNRKYNHFFKEKYHAKETFFSYAIKSMMKNIGAVFSPKDKTKRTLINFSKLYYDLQVSLLAKNIYGIFYNFILEKKQPDVTFEQIENLLLNILSSYQNLVFSESILKDIKKELVSFS